MRESLHAEWTKLRTLASTFWLLLAAAALTVAVSAAAAAAVRCPSGGCADDPAKISLTGIYLGQAVVAVLAVMAVSGEYGTGMIRLTLAATPRRLTVLAAKAAVLTGLVLVTGTIAVFASLLAGGLILPGHGIGPSHGYPAISASDGPVLRAAFGSVLYLALIALLSLGAATAAAGSRRRHRGRPRAALRPPDHRRLRRQRDPVAAPRADRADDGRAGHPGHHRPEHPAHQPLGRTWRARRLGRRRTAARRAAAPDA